MKTILMRFHLTSLLIDQISGPMKQPRAKDKKSEKGSADSSTAQEDKAPSSKEGEFLACEVEIAPAPSVKKSTDTERGIHGDWYELVCVFEKDKVRARET